jgi:hypothetical protein
MKVLASKPHAYGVPLAEVHICLDSGASIPSILRDKMHECMHIMYICMNACIHI